MWRKEKKMESHTNTHIEITMWWCLRTKTTNDGNDGDIQTTATNQRPNYNCELCNERNDAETAATQF